MLRSIPPGGHPISLTSGLFGIFKGVPGSDVSFIESNGRPIMPTSSGTAAISTALLSLKKLSPRGRVIVPAYTCPQVVAAVVKAGLTPELCDVQPNSFQMDLDQLSTELTEDTLAVIGVHLFGLPENIKEIRRLAENKNTFLIEDAAQSFPYCLFNKTKPQIFGQIPAEKDFSSDFVVFSFGRGKPFNLLAGGALQVNNPRLTEHVNSVYGPLPISNLPFICAYYLKVLLYAVFFRPNLYWIPERIPWLRLGETIFTLNFRIEKMQPGVKPLGSTLALKCSEILEKRMELTEVYKEHLGKFKEEFSFFPGSVGKDVMLHRFPIIFRRRETRDQVLHELREKGLGATGMYPVPLNEQEGVACYLKHGGSFPNAKFVSERVLTLPLHEYVTQKDVKGIEEVFRDKL
jgi:dTDP-4-amino-4,6-dideoxygalactose transaminase